MKCYLQLANTNGKQELQEGLEVIESTNLKYFTKEMTAEFFAMKGFFLAQLGKSEEANKSFSAAAQMHDVLVNAWALWGDYLESIFVKEKWDVRQMHLGISAITCYLHACRHQNEAKSRKYLAKVLWLLSYDDETGKLADAVEKYNLGIPALTWLAWIPQLLTCLLRSNEGKIVVNILSLVGRQYPQAVYFPLRTLYLTLKIDQREKLKAASAQKQQQQQQNNLSNASNTISTMNTTPNTPTVTISKPTTPTVSSNDNASNNQTTSADSNTTTNTSTISVTPLLSQIKTEPIASTDSNQQPNTIASPIITVQQHASIVNPQTTPTNQTAQQQQRLLAPASAEQMRVTTAMWRCSKVLNNQRELHPTVLSSLEGIVDQFAYLRENWYEEVLRHLRQGLAKCYSIAFENRFKVQETTATPALMNFVRKLVATFGIGIESAHPLGTNANQTNLNTSAASESLVSILLVRRAQATAQDPFFQSMKQRFTNDFDFDQPESMKLTNLTNKLTKWIKLLEIKVKQLPKSILLEDKCRFLGTFSRQTADIELFGEFLLPKHNYFVRIARFMPRVDIVHKHNIAARRLYIRGHNGKIYPYLILNDTSLMESRNEERVLQILRLLNHYMSKQKETARRFLNFTLPKVVAISPQIRLVEDNCDSLSLLDIYKQFCFSKNMEIDQPITKYYDRLTSIQSKGSQASQQTYRDILKEIQSTLVPSTMLKQWAISTFVNATDYCMFRKQFTLQFALCNVAEYVLHLTRQNLEMIYIHQDSGLINISYFRFDTDDQSGELIGNRPVPFRLTPNINELITSIGVNGPLIASMIAIARCLVQPNFKGPALMRAILRDEFLYWYKRVRILFNYKVKLVYRFLILIFNTSRLKIRVQVLQAKSQ